MAVVRYGIPAALELAGLICLLALPESSRVEAWAMFTGAASAEWPEEDEAGRRRGWNLPEGIATPESEAAEPG